MNNEHLQRQVSSLWGTAQQQGWTRRCRFQVGWRVQDEARRRSLAKRVLSVQSWYASPAEDYEPEDDPAEIIAHVIVESPSRALIEEKIRWASHLAEEFGATLTRVGLGAA